MNNGGSFYSYVNVYQAGYQPTLESKKIHGSPSGLPWARDEAQNDEPKKERASGRRKKGPKKKKQKNDPQMIHKWLCKFVSNSVKMVMN